LEASSRVFPSRIEEGPENRSDVKEEKVSDLAKKTRRFGEGIKGHVGKQGGGGVDPGSYAKREKDFVTNHGERDLTVDK